MRNATDVESLRTAYGIVHGVQRGARGRGGGSVGSSGRGGRAIGIGLCRRPRRVLNDVGNRGFVRTCSIARSGNHWVRTRSHAHAHTHTHTHSEMHLFTPTRTHAHTRASDMRALGFRCIWGEGYRSEDVWLKGYPPPQACA